MQQDAAESEELCDSWEATLRGSAAGGKEVPHTATSAADILWQTIRCGVCVCVAGQLQRLV
jgi:hypothetical protein